MTAKEAIKNIKGLIDGCCGPELDDTREAFDLAIKALEAQDGTDTNVGGTISRQAAIDVEGLNEQIRCEMCRNLMHTDRGCDGNCKYDEKLYERIMQILGARIKPLPSAQPEITDEQAIEHLQSTGWMQNHDREMYESGLREQLSDDSGSYDSLVPCGDAISRKEW